MPAEENSTYCYNWEKYIDKETVTHVFVMYTYVVNNNINYIILT